MLREIRPAIVVLVALTLITGLAYPLAMTGIAEVDFPVSGARQPDRARRQGRRLRADRPGVHQRQIFPRPAVGDHRARSARTRPRPSPRPTTPQIRRLESRADQQGADRPREGRHRQAQEGEPVDAGAGRSGDHVGQRPRPGYLAGGRAFPGAARRQGAQLPEDRVRELVADNTEGRLLGLLGEPRVNVLQLNLALDHLTAG